MRKRHTTSLITSLVIITLLVLCIRNRPLDTTVDQDPAAAPRGSHPGANHGQWHAAPGKPHAADAIGPVAIGPVAIGEPTPPIPFARGENQRRRYHQPQTRELPQPLQLRRPGVMAMLPQDGRTTLLPEEMPAYTLVAKRLVLDTSALDRIVKGETARLIAPTVGGQPFDLRIEKVKTRSAQTHTLIGHVNGEPETSKALLVYHDGILHGSVNRYSENHHVEYQTLPDGHLIAREIDEKSMTARCGNPSDCGHAHHPSEAPCPQVASEHLQQELAQEGIQLEPAPSSEGGVVEDTTGWTTVDVVVGYGRQARISAGSTSAIEALIIASIDRMNLAFSNSLISNTEMMLLGTIEDPVYAYPGAVAGSMSTGDELGNLNNLSDGILDTVSDYATQLGADFKSFVMKDSDGSAGIAFRPGSSSIVAMTYMTSTRITFGHELGHNLGCDHSWGDSSQAYHAHYGWRLDPDGDLGTTNDQVRTIMAYDWGWGVRIPYYANPSVLYNGVRTGAVKQYNATGDTTCDPRYVTGGYGFTSGSGFDGTHPELGAQNALTILNGQGVAAYGAGFASARATRSSLNVPMPAGGAQFATGESLEIFFTGGDHEYTATVELYKGGVLDTTIASGINPATDRRVIWAIPTNQISGIDYFVRVTLVHPSYPDEYIDSADFTINSGDPKFVSQSPSTTPSGSSLSQITVTFNEAMDTTSFAMADDLLSFTGPSGNDLIANITGSSWSNGDRSLTISFNTQTSPGYYRMHFGAQILDLEGNAIDQDGDGTKGEVYQDSYTALTGLLSGGSIGVPIWQDMVGTDAPDAGWVFAGVGGSSSSWAIGAPAESAPFGPANAHDGGNIIAQNLSGNHIAGEESYAQTPAIDCSGYSNVSLIFFSWSGVEKADEIYLDASPDGGTTWQRVFNIKINNGDYNDSEWAGYAPQLLGLADNKSAFKLRWGLIDFNKGKAIPSTGWQIDSITLKGDTAADPLPAPRVVNHSPSGSGSGPHSSIWVHFTNPMDTASFSLADISSFKDPSNADITANGFNWVTNTLLRIDFPAQSGSGTYAMSFGPQILDTHGLALDQDGDGTPGESGEDAYTASFTISNFTSIYDTWAAGTFTGSFSDKAVTSNPDGDELENLLEFAFGTDPTASSQPPIQFVTDGNVTTAGIPLVVNFGTVTSPDYRAVFGRRKDHLQSGLTYTVLFSADLSDWVAGSTPPTRLTSTDSSGPMEAVSVPFPATIASGGSDVTPSFFKVVVAYD